jgi:hypothetical protein
LADPIIYITDDTDTLIPTGTTFGWDDYAAALSSVESLIVRLFSEADIADSAAESALSAADGVLDPIAQQIRDLTSDVQALQSHTDLLSAQALPVTGGQYTHLITESFRTSSVRDTVSAYDNQPLTLKTGAPQGCPARPALEIDQTTQILRQKREGNAVVFDGLPAGDKTPGGTVTVDKVFGTPVTDGTDSTGNWTINVGSTSALAPGFSGVGPSGVAGITDVPKPSWLPDTYSSGGASRIHIALSNPSPFTEVRLRGALLASDAETMLLETVVAVDSRPDTSDPASRPTRPITETGVFTTGYYPWQNVTSGQPSPVLITAPGRVNGSSDRAVQLAGLLAQPFDGVQPGGHAILRYRTSLPAAGTSIVSVATSFVQVYYYGTDSPSFGIDSPLDVETFRDTVYSQAGSYAGWSQSVHLLSPPLGTVTSLLVIGADPFLFQGQEGEEINCAVCYSDIWVCDEAITRQWSTALPRPSASQLTGPGNAGAVRSYVNEDAVDSVSVEIGNDTGALVISDAWITVGQASPSIVDGSLWNPDDGRTLSRDSQVPPYALNLPADNPKGRAARDPLLLHQARYAGQGAAEYDVSESRMRGRSAKQSLSLETAPLRASTGLPSSRGTLGGRRSIAPAAGPVGVGGYWKGLGPDRQLADPGLTPITSGLAARWQNLYSVLASLSRARNAPPSRALRILSPILRTPVTQIGSFYVYSMGLSSLSLMRRDYAPSGLYVTNPMRTIDGENGAAVAAEIHEVSVVTDPPLASLNNRVRFWVIPDKNGGGTDSPGAQLARAVPLDTTTPRATFHSAVESLPGLSPALSDTALSLGVGPPAFYVTPSAYNQTLQSLDPDTAASGLRLDYVPYINREAIHNITYTIAAGDATNPNVYDPNAVRPIIDYLSNFDSGFISSVTSSNDPTAHVEPNSVNTASLPFLDQSQKAVDMVLPYTITYAVKKQPVGLAALITLQPPVTIINADGTVSVNFVAPTQEGDYSFDATAVFPGPPSLTYVVHVNFTVKNAYASSDILKAVTGYRPVAIKLTLPSGRVILPDSLGPPRPGEIIEAPNEVLQVAQSISLTNNAASTAEYSFTSATSTSDATQVLTTTQLSFVTAHSPVAAGAQGTAIDLYWHRSSEFDATQGGILNRFDIKIPPSDYVIDAHTGQITVNAQPPYNWDVTTSGYDQVIANYFWRVGNVAPREWFPPPSIYDVQEFTGSPLDFIGSPVDTRPATTTPVLSGYSYPDSGELMTNPTLTNDGQNWTTYNSIEWVSGNPDGGGSSLQLSDEEGIYQDVPYAGPGTYYAKITSQGWGNSGSGGNLTYRLCLFQAPYSDANVIEETGWVGGSNSSTYIHWDHTTRTWPDDQTFFTSEDTAAATYQFTTVPSPSSVKPYLIRMEIQERSNDEGNGNYVYSINLHAGVQTAVYGCPSGYTLSSDQTVCNIVPQSVTTFTQITVSGGESAGEVVDAPTDVASLLSGPISQNYPVTRNVTNYSSDTAATLQPANMDPLSPDYYPVIEYRIDPGGILRFGTDLSTLGPFAGTQIDIQYEYLDVNPRIALEVLPVGEDPLTPVSSTPDLPRSQVDTVLVSSLLFLINARY